MRMLGTLTSRPIRFTVIGCFTLALLAAAAIRLSAEDHQPELTDSEFDLNAPRVSEWEQQAVVVHAAGAAVLHIPSAWAAREVPYRREVRLQIAEKLPATEQELDDGLWMSCHYGVQVPQEETLLSAFAAERVATLAAQRVTSLSPAIPLRVSGHPAIRVDYATGDSERIYLVIATPWGHCELQAVGPVQQWPHRLPQFESIVAGLQIRTPMLRDETPQPQTQDARPIFGSWKSYRGRMRLDGSGQITIVPDVPKAVDLQTGARVVSVIRGTYRAQGDLLYVTWEDNSQLNFRWRQVESRLLLTDHDGHMTQLKRILE